MKLYYAPGACSVAIHVLLEEIGKPYDKQVVSLRNREQFDPAYVAMNPKSQVPTLVRDDGRVLTELPAIAFWLAATNPELDLLPKTAEEGTRVLEAVNFIVGNIHPQGFTRLGRTDKFTSVEAEYENVRATGRRIIDAGMAILDRQVSDSGFFLDRYTVADPIVFYIELWAVSRLKFELGPNCAIHFASMMKRPAVQRVLADEGISVG